MTEQIQILQRRLVCFSRALKVLSIALKVFSMYLGRKRRWMGRSLFIIIWNCLWIIFQWRGSRIFNTLGFTFSLNCQYWTIPKYLNIFFSRTNKKINKNAGSYYCFRLPTFTQYCKTSVYDPEINDMCSAALEWIFVVMLSLTSLIYLKFICYSFYSKIK